MLYQQVRESSHLRRKIIATKMPRQNVLKNSIKISHPKQAVFHRNKNKEIIRLRIQQGNPLIHHRRKKDKKSRLRSQHQ